MCELSAHLQAFSSFFFLVCYTMTYVPSNKRWFCLQFEGIEALVGKAIENVWNDHFPSFW